MTWLVCVHVAIVLAEGQIDNFAFIDAYVASVIIWIGLIKLIIFVGNKRVCEKDNNE